MHGSLESVGNRPALRFERRLGHSVERVWRAVTDPRELERWFVATVEWTPAVGETFEAAGETVEVTEVDPPRLLAWTWATEAYRFELAPDGDGCLLVFVHVFDDRSVAAQHAAGWETYFKRLDAHLAGDYLSEEEAHAGVAELHERYAERFGLNPEVGRRAIAAITADMTLEEGPMLRLERRFAHPVERVWRAITDPDERASWFPGGAPNLEVAATDPPRRLTGSWYGDRLGFDLRPDDDGGVLVFTHAFDDRAKAARDAAGWESCFLRLAALLAGTPMSEAEALQTWSYVHERYAERFGVDPELGRRALAEHSPQP